MMERSLHSVQSALLPHIFLIATVVQGYGNIMRCPEDVQYSTGECMTQYRTQMHSVDMSYTNLYSGVDVEQIRLICTTLRIGLKCAHRIKQHCPDTHYNDIEVELNDVYNVAQLCSYPDLYEVYARRRSCYYEMSASTELCYQKFRADTELHRIQAMRGNKQFLHMYCNKFHELVGCMQRHVATNPKCGIEGINLIEYLLKPNIQMSEKCSNDTAKRPVSTTPKSGGKEYNRKNSQASNSARTVNSATFDYPSRHYLTLMSTSFVSLFCLFYASFIHR